jgi:hypothetical protein
MSSTADRMIMKIKAKDYLVREGEKVRLRKWPTKVEALYKSKEHYQKLLHEHVAQLSLLQQLLYASDRYRPSGRRQRSRRAAPSGESSSRLQAMVER